MTVALVSRLEGDGVTVAPVRRLEDDGVTVAPLRRNLYVNFINLI